MKGNTMGCFTIFDENGNHCHQGDYIKIYAKLFFVEAVLLAEGFYSTYGWVERDNFDYHPLDIHSATMMLEDGIDPKEIKNNPTDVIEKYRNAFFANDGFNENEKKITEYLYFEGFTGNKNGCDGSCQSIWYNGDDSDEESSW